MDEQNAISNESIPTLALKAAKAHYDHMALAMADDTSPARSTAYTNQLSALKSLYDKYADEHKDTSPAEIRSALNAIVAETATEHMLARPHLNHYYPVFTINSPEHQSQVAAKGTGKVQD